MTPDNKYDRRYLESEAVLQPPDAPLSWERDIRGKLFPYTDSDGNAAMLSIESLRESGQYVASTEFVSLEERR